VAGHNFFFWIAFFELHQAFVQPWHSTEDVEVAAWFVRPASTPMAQVLIPQAESRPADR
jgi:hypothetical protein